MEKGYISMLLLTMMFSVASRYICSGCLQPKYVLPHSNVSFNFDLGGYYAESGISVSVNAVTILAILGLKGHLVYDIGHGVLFTGDARNGNISFLVRNITTTRAGLYKVEVGGGEKQMCQNVYILGKPTVWLSKAEAYVDVGGNVLFSCHGTSITTPSDHGLVFNYLWSVDGVSAENSGFSFTANKMTVSSITQSDQNKTVSCKVTENVEGGLTSDESNQETINVHYGPESLSLNPPDTTYTIVTGTKFTDIVCSAICNPLCSYVWTKDGHYLQGQKGHILSLGYLNRLKAGIYTCAATRSSYSLIKDIIVHVIYGPDEVLITPSKNNYTFNEGHLLNNILCSSECYPSCVCKWTKWSGKFNIDHGTLSLGNLTRQERGVYICNATNPLTQLQRTSQITVNVRYGPDKIILVPPTTSHTIVEGDALQNINCSDEECWPECAQTWINITSGKDIGTGGTLSLGTSTRYIKGEYKCISTNISPEIHRKTDKTIVVTVSYFPDVNIYNETSIEATEHNINISLLCSARGVPDRYTFFPWVQKAPDMKTLVKQYKGVSLGNHNRLVLQHLSYMNSGLYICSVTNNITNYKTGKKIATETLKVIVKGKPFVTESEHRVDGAIGKFVKLNVSFFSNDDTNPSVTWFKVVNDTRSQLNISSDGKFREMNSNQSVMVKYADVFVNQTGKKTQLEISNIAEDDFGYYEIEIINSIGSLSYRLELVPRDAEPIAASSLIVGATVGAAITAVLIAVVIIVAVMFLLRRFKRLRESRNEQKRDVVVGFINGHEYVNMNVPTGKTVRKAGSEERGETIRLTEQPYETLNPEGKSASTYEKLTTANQTDTQRSAASEYDQLDSERTNRPIYTGLEAEATTEPSNEERAKQRMNDKTRRMRPKDDIDKASEQNLGPKVAVPEAVYSNLKIRNA